MKNVRIRASEDEIAKSLQGNWRAEHLFALKQALAMFDFIGSQVAECDREIEAQLRSLQVHDGEPDKGTGKKRGRPRNAPKSDLRTQLHRMCGVDLTRIDGIDVTTRTRGDFRDWHRHVPLCYGRPFYELVGTVPGYQDYRRQSDERQD